MKLNHKYTIVSQLGMTPFSTAYSLSEAIADSVRARRLGLSGEIVSDGRMDATPDDCNEAAKLLGWDRDVDASDMDSPVCANVVASDLSSGRI